MTWTLVIFEEITEGNQKYSAKVSYDIGCLNYRGLLQEFPSLSCTLGWILEHRSLTYRTLSPQPFPTWLKFWCSGCRVFAEIEVECLLEDEHSHYRVVEINGIARTPDHFPSRTYSIPTICKECLCTRCTPSQS